MAEQPTGIIRTKSGMTFDVWGEPIVYGDWFSTQGDDLMWRPGVVRFKSMPDGWTTLFLNAIESTTHFEPQHRTAMTYTNGVSTTTAEVKWKSQ